MNSSFLSLKQLRQVEQEFIDIDLVDIAGSSICSWIAGNFTQEYKILFLIGGGHNAADGINAACKLKRLGYNITIVKTTNKFIPRVVKLLDQFKSLKGKLLVNLPSNLSTYNLIVDAILGIGLNDNLSNSIMNIVERVNSCGSVIVSIDTPTGLNAYTGEIMGDVINANYTLTFISDKPGFYTGDGVDAVGDVVVYPLLQPEQLPMPEATVQFNQINNISYSPLIRHKQNTNKGNFGMVAVIGGNKGMHGALYLAGRAALLCGSGKVILASLDGEFSLDYLMPELIVRSAKEVLNELSAYDVIIIGPGFGSDNKALKFLTKFIERQPQNKIIFDADALNLVAINPELHYLFSGIRNKIITPHPGEAARLLGLSVNEVMANRFISINELSDKYSSATLLKGCGSLIRVNGITYINQTGNNALSNAGQGDTLCGIIASLWGQGLEQDDALRLAVYIHGLSAEYLAAHYHGYNGILASEIATASRSLLNKLLYEDVFPL